MTWVAYVDESMRVRSSSAQIYVLAAAMLDPASTGEVRSATAALVSRPHVRVHWRAMDERERMRVVNKVATLDSLHLVVVGTRLDPRRQERARRACLRRLLWELEAAGVQQVWLETRTASLNERDRAAVSAWRAQRLLSGNLRVDFAQPFGPSGEPLLWLPDVVAGAVAAAHGDGEKRYLFVLESLVEQFHVSLD